MTSRPIQILDTTLREGEQTPGVSFTIEQKIKIVNLLCDFGVDYIELGHPAVSKDIFKTISEINKLDLVPETVVHSRLKKVDINDAIDLKSQWVGLFFDVSKERLFEKYGINEERSLELISESISYAKNNGLKIRFTAEDAARTDLDYLLKVGKLVENAGADRFGFADTVGILHPQKISTMISRLVDNLNIPIHVHLHNDFGLATANALQAVQSGASCVDTTINGLGERCGITSLLEVTAALDELLNIDNNWNFDFTKDLSSYVDEITGVSIDKIRPISGDYCFTHNGGLHTAAVIKDPSTYESISPQKYGQTRNLIIDKFSGKKVVKHRFKKLGIKITDSVIIKILTLIKSKPDKTFWSDKELLVVFNSINKGSFKKSSEFI